MGNLSALANNVVQTTPVGVIEAFAGVNAPAGWLFCDGSAISRIQYPELFSALSTTYGSGDGSATFNIPDLRGRMPFGKGTHADVASLGQNEGASLDNRRPKHQHTVYDPSHGHSIQRTNVAASGQGTDTSTVYRLQLNSGAGYSDTQGNTTGIKVNPENASSSNSPTDAPPYLVVNYIIKAVADLPRGGWFYQNSPPVVTQLPSNPQIGEEVYHYENSVIRNKRWDGTQWTIFGAGGSTQPRFFVANEVGSTVSATNKATFNFVSVNDGNCWSAANNRFTAPITGSYYFHYSLLNSAPSAFYADFRKNGSTMSTGSFPRGYSGTQYIANTASGIIPLNAGDYIEIWITGGTMHSYHCFFTGNLMG